MAVGCSLEEAEKTYKLAEKRFLANDNAGALWPARKAQRLFCSLPGLANAITVYEVHATVATSHSSGRNWYAVLGVDGRSLTSGGVTHDAIKQGYWRLCLVQTAQEAWETLSVRHPPNLVVTPDLPRSEEAGHGEWPGRWGDEAMV